MGANWLPQLSNKFWLSLHFYAHNMLDMKKGMLKHIGLPYEPICLKCDIA